MKYKPAVVAGLVGTTTLGSLHEGHHAVEQITAVYSLDKPVIKAPAAALLPHGNEPEGPGGPLGMPMAEETVSTLPSGHIFQGIRLG